MADEIVQADSPAGSGYQKLEVTGENLPPPDVARTLCPLRCAAVPSRIWGRLRVLFTTQNFLVFLHWSVSLAVVALFSSALLSHSWRKIVVDRFALVFLFNKGKINGSLLNMTIAYSRTQDVYKECFVPPFVTTIGTVPRYGSGCHSFFAETKAAATDDNHEKIIDLGAVQMFCGPLSLLVAFAALLAVVIAQIVPKGKAHLLLCVAVLRVFNTIVCVILFACAEVITDILKKEDPAFPVPWPRSVREHSKVLSWQPAVIDWLVGGLLQLSAAALDIFRTRTFRSGEEVRQRTIGTSTRLLFIRH